MNARALRAPSTCLALAALAATACTSNFESQMVLSGYRVVGIEASPPEVRPDELVHLRVHDFNESAAPVAYRWRICLYSAGAPDAYRCLDERLERPFDGGAEATLDLGAGGLDLRGLLAPFPHLANDDGSTRTYERGFDVWIKLRSGPDCAGCDAIESVKRLTVREPTAATPPNANPVIRALDVVGTPARGGSIVLRVDTDAPEVHQPPGAREPRPEEHLTSWYTQAGETDPIRTFGDVRETLLRLPAVAGPFEVIVTVRDGRGGLAVTRRTIDVPPDL